ncbi:MAG: hypothetical protein R3F29_01440 [Planctomycetota bacterium]
MHAPRSHRVTATLLACAALAGTAVAQNTRADVRADFEKRRTKVLAEAGQRHLELGSWARDAGLPPQATTQFLRAVEVCEGKNPGATKVLNIMRSYGDAFWRRKLEHPPKAVLNEYQKRATAAEAKSRREHLELAERACKQKITDRAQEHYRTALELGAELEFDERSGWRIDKKKIDAELAEWLQGQTTKDDTGKPRFEAAGQKAPRLDNLKVHEDDALQVRTDLPGDAAKQLHALGTALLPHLRTRLDGAPTRQLVLTVFQKHADYLAYLEACGMSSAKVAQGFADYGTFQTLVAAQYDNGNALGDEELHSISLHELTHLFFHGIAPAGMPDWYSEGLAETFGAQGTFAWDGKTLTVGGALPKERIDAVRAAKMPLALLVDVRVLVLMGQDREKSRVYRAECQLLQRFLMQKDCPWHARFEHFEAQCRGEVLGAAATGKHPDPMPAGARFKQLFGEDLDKLETAFFAWLDQQ